MESFAREVPQPEMSVMVRMALFKTFKWDFITCASFTIVGECTGIFSCYFISFLIKYLRNEEAPYTEGVYLIIIFMVVSLVQQLCRNFYVQYGFITAVRMRRTLVAVLFSKVCNLSMKSLIETNSGKLISVISADLFAAERALTFTPLILAFFPVNCFAYMIIGFTSNWYNSLIVFFPNYFLAFDIKN